MIGFDSEYRVAPAPLHAANCQVMIRYVMPQTPFWVKALRNAEAAELLAAGIPIVSNYESTADRMKGGAAAGHADALDLIANWRVLGAPDGLTGWFSGDWDVQPSEVSACLDYLHAAADVLGSKSRVGCYGGLRLVAAAADAEFGIWQTVGWSHDAHGVLQWDPRAVVRQTGEQRNVGGVDVDVNEIINPSALGAWTPGGIDMTPAESQMLTEIHQSAVDFANWQFFSPGGREQVQGTHAWRMQSTLDNTNAIKDTLAQLLARPVVQPVDMAALGALIDQHQTAGSTPDEFALAVVAHLGLTVVAK
jgi:hypothetical protein